MKRKLSEEDKKLLLEWGHLEEDISQIERALSKTSYTVTDIGTGISKNIGAEEAKDILGNKAFLSGISRSAFHYTSSRETDDGLVISFDSSSLFRENEYSVPEYDDIEPEIE